MPELAAAVEHTERSRLLRHGRREGIALVPASEPATEPAPTPSVIATRRGKGNTALLEAINAGYGSVPALDPPRSLQEMTEIAAAEHAERTARSGL